MDFVGRRIIIPAQETGTWTCDVEAARLFMPMAATVDFRGRVHVVTSALVPGAAEVITLQ